jgi:hypothetical protein
MKFLKTKRFVLIVERSVKKRVSLKEDIKLTTLAVIVKEQSLNLN